MTPQVSVVDSSRAGKGDGSFSDRTDSRIIRMRG